MKATKAPDGSSFASVIIRARPPLAPEAPYGHCARTEGRKVLLTTDAQEDPAHRKKRQPQRTRTVECQYDKVLGIQTDQDEVWTSVLPTVDKAFEGYNVTLFTYGMTGSGKTHTMLGPTLMESAFAGQKSPTTESLKCSQQRGIVPRVMQHIFQRLPDADVTLSYLQIYQERCYDLLQPAALAKPLRIREESLKAKSFGQSAPVYVEGLTEVSVVNLEDCLYQLISGFTNVAFRATNYNEQSSRAHCVLTLTIRQRVTSNSKAYIRESKLRLVDLAGNERWVTAGPSPSPQHARELATINKSLHTLGNCMQALSQPSSVNRDARHVPYRNSTLTLLLRDTLAGNSYTLMVCTICCSSLYQVQTLCTLRFADRVKRVQMKAYVRDTLDPKEAKSQMQAETWMPMCFILGMLLQERCPCYMCQKFCRGGGEFLR